VDAVPPTPGLDAPLDIAPGRVHTAINMHGNGPESRAVIDALDAPHVVAHGGSGPAWLDGILERWRWVRLVEAFGMPGDPDEVAISRPLAPVEVPGAVVIHVGAFYGSRQWPADRVARAALALTEQGRRVGLTGSAAGRPRAVAVARQAGLGTAAVQAGTTGLAEFAAQISGASLVISADTGAAHLASAYAIPSVILFGPAPPQEWGPPPGPHIVLTDPAVRRGETFSAEPDPALLAVTSSDVLAAVADLPDQG